jgi:hypothetical protein
MLAERELDETIPSEAVLRAVYAFLDSAEWTLEFNDGIVPIPRRPEPVLVSRAFIKAHVADVFLGDHFEAVVALAPEQVGENIVARGGLLKLYFDRDGHFVSEDRYPPVR